MVSLNVPVAHGLIPSHRDLQLIRSGDNDAFRQLLAPWEPIIKTKAKGFSAPGCSAHDFYQVGRLALFRAAKSFKTGGAKFNTYATTAIVRAMIDLTREHADEAVPGNIDAAFAEAVSYDDPIVGREITAEIDRWLNAIDGRSQQVVKMMFFMDVKQVEIAKTLGVTSARISQIISDLRKSAKSARWFELN
ncbi:MAG: sigma-70 family RNA polymerase sigma factor [Tepidisphaeraceae bacterium]